MKYQEFRSNSPLVYGKTTVVREEGNVVRADFSRPEIAGPPSGLVEYSARPTRLLFWVKIPIALFPSLYCFAGLEGNNTFAK